MRYLWSILVAVHLASIAYIYDDLFIAGMKKLWVQSTVSPCVISLTLIVLFTELLLIFKLSDEYLAGIADFESIIIGSFIIYTWVFLSTNTYLNMIDPLSNLMLLSLTIIIAINLFMHQEQ